MGNLHELAVFGHTNMDFLIDLPTLPGPDSSVEMLQGRQFFGGVAADIARGAAKLGVHAALVSWVGSNFPDEYAEALRGDGVDLTHFTRLSSYFTPTCWIMTDANQHQFSIINQGPMRDLPSFELKEEAIAHSDIIHLTTGSPAYYVRVAEAAKARGKEVGFDPAQEIHYSYDSGTELRAILERTDRFFSNRSEASKVLSILQLRDLEELAAMVPLMVTTLGKDGSQIRRKGEVIQVPALPPARVADPTGAGDGYRAGFYAALLRGRDPYECGLAGASASSYVIEAHGPQNSLPTWEQVLDRIEKAPQR